MRVLWQHWTIFTNLSEEERKKVLHKSRSVQEPGSEFQPRDESDKNYCGFLGPSWCNKKVNPQTYVPCGSNELLLNNIAHQKKENLTIQNKFSIFQVIFN